MDDAKTYSVRLTRAEIVLIADTLRFTLKARAEREAIPQTELNPMAELLGKIENHRDSITAGEPRGSLI